jgi:hypothetical protein
MNRKKERMPEPGRLLFSDDTFREIRKKGAQAHPCCDGPVPIHDSGKTGSYIICRFLAKLGDLNT